MIDYAAHDEDPGDAAGIYRPVRDLDPQEHARRAALWLSVLMCAVSDARGDIPRHDYAEVDDSKHAMQATARDWLLGFGANFRRACWLAGVEPAYVRRIVEQGHLDAVGQGRRP
ncbi:hypothetical protein JL101_035470 (plasmid) [Skermanella rosea]|uniref:hypothetical protein n=1 Tax=Skermanella rosea TaxID=1817965 RepID=UPI001933CCCC|nr:hypothetical protein [Skermanella rosea]UEM08099.1 hypothetical protein JL101_035470 [Skermanella rosea]